MKKRLVWIALCLLCSLPLTAALPSRILPPRDTTLITFRSGPEKSFAARVIRFADETAKVCDNYGKKQWQASYKSLSVLKEEYKRYYPKLSDPDKKSVTKAMGKYYGLLVKAGAVSVDHTIKAFLEKIPDFFEGLKEAFEGLKQDIQVEENQHASDTLSC